MPSISESAALPSDVCPFLGLGVQVIWIVPAAETAPDFRAAQVTRCSVFS